MTMFLIKKTSILATAAIHILLLQGEWLRMGCCTAQQSNGTNTTSSPSAWTGCINPSNPAALVTVGQKTTICIVTSNTTNWSMGSTYSRLSFQPAADQYSRFLIPNSYADLVIKKGNTALSNGNNVTVHAESQLQLSFQRLYFDVTNNLIYPFITAIIDVKRGVVQGITWDDACVFCGQSECLENTFDFNGNAKSQSQIGQPTKGCYYTKEQCNQNANACDLLLYVVWTGTDSNGLVLRSSANRFSAFPAQKLQDRISQSLPSFFNIRRDL